MKGDRFIYAPGGLAIGRGFAYLFAFLAAFLFISATERIYYVNAFIFFCGCFCDYVESFLPTSQKSRLVRNVSLVIIIVVGIIAIIDLIVVFSFENAMKVTKFIAKYEACFSLLFSTLWGIPLFSGIFQCAVRKEMQYDLVPLSKSLWGYNILNQGS